MGNKWARQEFCIGFSFATVEGSLARAYSAHGERNWVQR